MQLKLMAQCVPKPQFATVNLRPRRQKCDDKRWSIKRLRIIHSIWSSVPLSMMLFRRTLTRFLIEARISTRMCSHFEGSPV